MVKKQKGFGIFESVLVIAFITSAILIYTQSVVAKQNEKKLTQIVSDLVAVNDSIESIKTGLNLANNTPVFLTSTRLNEVGLINKLATASKASSVSLERTYGDLIVTVQKISDTQINHSIELQSFNLQSNCNQSHVDFIAQRVPNLKIENCANAQLTTAQK